MNVTRIGIDLAKHVFQVHAVARSGHKVFNRQLRRHQVLAFFEKLEPTLIGMEACSSAHYWARKLGELGHTVKLIAPQFVKPYVKGNKNDANDAEAICEAVGRPSMRFVPVKTVDQQDIQSLHRVRSELVRQRTAKANQIRGLLAEYGLIVPQGVGQLRRALPDLIELADNGLQMAFRQLLVGLQDDLRYLDERVGSLDRCIEQLAREHEAAQRLMQLRGVGPITATALIAALGDARQFKCARQASAWVGIVPGQHGSGGKDRLLSISKRGDAYLRTLLIHGARAVLNASKNKDDPLSRWVQSLCARRNKNVATVALANKTMRYAWALLSRQTHYDPEYKAAVAA